MADFMRAVARKLPPGVRAGLVSAWRRKVAAPISASAFRQALTARAPELRGPMFDAVPPGSLLLADTGEEVFAVLRDDEVIARSMFTTGIPFDFGNLLRARALLAETQAPTHLIDIGANLGSVSIAAVKRGLFERAEAIEPEPRNFRLLTANVYLNALEDRIVRHQVALGDQDGATLQFALSSENFGDHRVAATAPSDAVVYHSTIAVPSRRLDSLLPDLDPGTAMLWMDVQGYEGHVLAGAPRILAGRPPLALEFWPSALATTGSYPVLRQALVEAGYRSFHVLNDQSAATPLTPASLDALHDRLLPTLKFVDLLVV